MEEVKKLYNALIGKGYTSTDLGDEKVFAEKMQDAKNRKELYDYVSSRGDFKIGSYDNYEKRLGSTVQPVQPEVSTIEDAPKVEEKPQENQESDLLKPQPTETPSLLNMGAKPKDYFAEAGAKAREAIRQERQAREYQEIMKPLSGFEGKEQKKVLEERKQQIESQLNQPGMVRNAAARTNMAKNLENIDKELQVLNEQQNQWSERYGAWTPSSARRFREQTMEQTWYDPYAVVPEEYKALATKQWGKEGSEDAYFSAWMNLTPEQREAFIRKEHVKSFFNEETTSKMQGIRERATTYANNALSEIPVSVDPRHSATAMAARTVNNIGVQTTKALDKAEEIKQAYNNHQLDEGFFTGAYKGMKDGLTDIDNWTGIYMIGEMTNLYDIADKMEKGVQLSQAEEDFLDAQAYKLAVEAALADDLGWGYKSGNATGASVLFMLQMLASPIGGASGKAIDKGFAAVGRRAIDKFGKGILKKLLTKAPVKKVAKGLVGTVGKGIGQTILFGSDRVAAGTMQRHLGNEMVAERANEEFNAGVQAKAGEDWGTALFKEGVSASMENISEFAGGAFIDDFTKAVGKTIAKEFLDAIGGPVGRRLANAASRQKANKIFQAIANNKWGQHAVNISKSVQNGMAWDGLINEYLEEVLNNAANVMIGDMSVEDFTSLEKNAETILGLAWTSGFFTANSAVSRVGGYIRGNIALRRTDRAARQTFTGDMQEKWNAYTQALSQANGYEEVEQLYKGLIADISNNQDKETARAQITEATAYMTNYVKMMGMNAATEEAEEEEPKTPAQQEVESAQGEGIAAHGTEKELDVVEEMDQSYNQLAEHLGGTNVEDWLLQYGETADKQLEAIRGSELDEQTKAMADTYLTSAQRYEGLLLANQEEVDAIVEEAAKEFDANVNKDLGNVIQVLTTQDKVAYVIQGNPNEREQITLRYNDGSMEQASSKVVEKVLSESDAQAIRGDMLDGVRKSAIAEIVARMQGIVPNATQMQMPVGHSVVVDGQAGVVAGVNEDGTMQIQMQGGNAVNALPQQVMDAQAYNDIMERKARAREGVTVSAPVREEAEVPVSEEAATEAVAAVEEMTEAQKLLQEYMDESVSLEDRQAIVENNVAQAKQAAMEAQAEFDAMNESKPQAKDYTNIAEFKQAQEQWKAQMQEKQQLLDLARQQEATWNEVQSGINQSVVTEEISEQTSTEAAPVTPQVTEDLQAEAKNHNSKHDIKALAKEIGVSAKRIQRVIDFANQIGVKLNFANVTRTEGDKGAFTNADNMASKREITMSKYMLAKGMAIEWVMGHELTHQIKADGNAAQWETYKQTIINALGQEAFDKRVKTQSKIYSMAGAYKNMPANEFIETMEEEVCADAAGDMLLNPDNMNKVMGVPQSLASRIWNGLKNMVTFSTPSKIKQAVDAWQQLAEGNVEVSTDEEGKKHSIVGVTGARALDKIEHTTRRMDNLTTAKEMATIMEPNWSDRMDKSAHKIWLATGWDRGTDGMWRYELVDSADMFDPTGMVDYKKRHPNYERYLALVDKSNSGEALTEKEQQQLAFLTDQYGYDKLHNSRKLKDYLDFDELYDAYPELKNINIRFVDFDGEKLGNYNRTNNTITLDNRSQEEMASVLFHEVQHAIQAIEGFARGGNLESAGSYDNYQRLAGEVEARNVQERLGESAKERKQIRLGSTEDIDREEQTVKRYSITQSEAEQEANKKGSAESRTSKATQGERSDADSHNSSSKGLPLESSERLSVSALASPKDFAKIRKNTEILKRATKKIINEGGLKRKMNTPSQAVSALGDGLHLEKSGASQSYYGDYFEGDYLVDEKVVHLRISTHPASGDRMGNAKADHKASIVVRKNGEHHTKGEHNGYEEIVYDPAEISPDEAANAIVYGVKSLIETGKYVDTTGKAKKQTYPYVDEAGVTRYSIPSVNSVTEAAGRLEENVGEVDADKGDVRYSVHNILRGKERENAIKDLMAVTGRSRATVLKWLKAEESLAKVILDKDNVALLDIEADESVPSIWNNSDYPQGTVEFSNICKKRLPFTTIYQRLQKEYPNMVFDAQTLNTIRETMKDAGKDVACALCFVEDRRQLLGEIGQGFIDAVQGNGTKLNDKQKVALNKLAESGDRYVPNLYDILTLDGMKKLRKEHPAVAQAFIEYNNARGMQAGRLFQAYSAYNREILKYSDKKVKSINDNGGLRIFSFSDFEAHHLIDLVQVLTDCAAKGIKVQGYTKVPAFAKAVKDTGAKINRSLIPKGVGYVDADYVPKEGEAVSPNVINGKRLLFDTVEGIDVNDPNFFDSTNSKSVGNILVVINDEHARIAMADPFVDYLVGFHTSQAKEILKGKGIDTWVNYKNDQMDKVETTDKNGNKKLTNAPNHGINIYTDVFNVAEAEGNPIKTAKQFTERFLEECNKRGYVPRFYRFLNRAKDGRFLYTPGYHKFLPDFKLFDKNGKILTQEPVMPIFDNEFNKQILEDYVRDVKEELPLDNVYEAVKEAIGLGGKKFSINDNNVASYIYNMDATRSWMWVLRNSPKGVRAKGYGYIDKDRLEEFQDWYDIYLDRGADEYIQALEELKNKATKKAQEYIDEVIAGVEKHRDDFRRLAEGDDSVLSTSNAAKFSISAGHKQKQLDVIQESNPVGDDYHTWIRTVDDIKSFKEALDEPGYADFKGEDLDPSYTWGMIEEALQSGLITVYSSKPIENGNFVTPSRMEAESYAGNGKVYKATLPLQDIAWIDPTQGQVAKVDETKFSISADILAANERFNEELDEYIKKGTKANFIFHIGQPLGVMKIFFPELPIVMRPRVINKASNTKHDVDATSLYNLPQYIAEPIFVFQREDGAIGILTEMMDNNGKNVCVAVELNKKIQDGGTYLDVNDIRSIHGRDVKNIVLPIIHNNTLKYADKEKALDWFSSASSIYQQEITSQELSDATKIVQDFQNPPILEDESSQNIENAKSGEQKYSLPAGIPRRRKGEGLMDYANRIADILYAQRNATRDWEFQEPAIALARNKYEERVASGWYQTQEALQDSMLGLKVFMQSVLGEDTYIEDVAGVENAYLGENRLSSVNFAEASEFTRLVFKPMLEEVAKLAKNDKQRQVLVDYMMAKHGLERNRVMAEKDAQAEAKGNQMMTLDELRAKYRNKDYAGLTALTGKKNIRAAEAEAQAMVDAYESTHDTSALWDKVKKTNTATLTKMRESGLLSQEMYDSIANMYEFYIPLRGFDEKTSDEAYAYLTHKDSAFNAPIRKAEGRKSKADDPFAQMQSMAESAIMQGNRNLLVKQKFLNFVLNHPSDLATVSEMWITYDRVNKEWTQITANIADTDTPADVARKTREFNETMEKLHELFPGRYQKAGGRNRIPYRVIAKNLSEHQIIVKRNGVDYVITVNGSPRAAQAVNGMTNPDSGTGAVNEVFQYGEKVNRVLSGVYTSYNPDFLWSNFIRDMLYTNSMSYVKESPAWAWRFNKNFFKFNPGTMVGLLNKWDNGKLDMNNETEALFYQFMKNGGETGYANIRNIEQHKSEIKEALKKANGRISTKLAWDAVKNKLEFVSRAAENGARFAAFATSMQMGRSVERAIYDAKEVSVNFNKKGSGAKFMGATGQTNVGNVAAFTSGLGRSLYVFWNAAIQGSTNFGRQVKRHPVRALTVSAVMFGLGVLMSMVGGDDEDDENAFYNLPENIRRTNIMMRFGNHWLTLPLPVEYRAMYGMGQLAGEVLSGKSRMSDEELGLAILQQVSQMAPIDVLGAGGGWNAFTPSWAKPVTDAYVLEKNWAGQPLYKDWDTYAPEWTKAYDSADQNIVGFTRWLNEVSGGNDHRKGWADINPAKIEAVIDGYFGGISALTKNLVKTGEMVFGERDYQPRNIPLLRRVVYKGDERTAYRRVNDQYRKYKVEHDELQREIRGYEGDMEMGTRDWTEDLDRIYNSPEIEQYYILDWYDKDIAKLNREFNETTDKEEKAAIRKEINLLKAEAVKEIDELSNSDARNM